MNTAYYDACASDHARIINQQRTIKIIIDNLFDGDYCRLSSS